MAPNNGLTIIENGYAQTWSDPENINLGLFTFGTDYMDLRLEEKSQQESVDLHLEKFAGRTSFVIPMAEIDQSFPFEGSLWINSVANMNLVKLFFAKHQTLSSPKLYLILRYGANIYEEFPDKDLINQKFAIGWISDLTTSYSKCRVKVKGNFVITW